MALFFMALEMEFGDEGRERVEDGLRNLECGRKLWKARSEICEPPATNVVRDNNHAYTGIDQTRSKNVIHVTLSRVKCH